MRQSETLLDPSCIFSAENEPVEIIFEDAVGRAVDDIFSTLGENPKQAIYRHLKTVYGIEKEDIPHKIDVFANAIERTFGLAGKAMEIKIIERLHSRHGDFRFSPKSGELNFVDYIADLQRSLQPKPQYLCFAIRAWQELNYTHVQS